MSKTPSREEALFADALAQPTAARGAYLATACGEDMALLARLVALVAAHERSATLMGPAPGMAAALHEEDAGETIGRYKLLQKLGEGGCGVVWMAEQAEPVRRRVALKVIKLGMDTKAVVARFEAERQALALMDHPNIAKVFDAGSTESGRPFFVMELVRGVPITRFCDDNQLTPRARLELFNKVCQAVQHAHQKGIIHRDLKPSNILVTVNDGVATPKVIDFGIAKATQGRLTDETLFTAFDQFIGTPVYMSPEQAEMSSLDVDTRTDIYSLGILLYELLTGRPPFDPKAFAQAGVERIRQQIREVEPPRPSARLRTLAESERTTIARLRSTAPAQLSLILRGDLDWIVMRCIEKDRTRRYDTANSIASDIERHLRHEPVVARPPSTGYLLQKLVQRHRVGVVAAAAVVCSLVAGLGISVWALVKERAARERAVAAERGQIHLREMAQQAQANEAMLRRSAEAQELAARRRAYSADMNLVLQALGKDDLSAALALLDRQRPEPGREDLRRWEWQFYWHVCQGDARTELCRLPGPPRALAASADGNWIAVAGRERGAVLVHNVRTGQQFRPAAGNDTVLVAFSPRRAELAVASSEGPPGDAATRVHSVSRWNLATQRVESRLELGGPCLSLDYSADDEALVTSTGNPDDTITVWGRQGEKVATHPAKQWLPDSHHHSFAVSPDFAVAAYHASRNEIRVVNLQTGVQQWTAEAANELVAALAFSPDGKTLASGSAYQEATIRLWDVDSGTEIGRMEAHHAWVSDLVFLDDNTLASASADQSIRVWDIPSRQVVNRLRGHKNEVWRLARRPDSRIVSSGKDGTVLLWDLSVPRTTRVVLPAVVLAWSLSPDGKSVLTLDEEGSVAEWRGRAFQDRTAILNLGAVEKNFHLAKFSPFEPVLAVGSPRGRVALWNLESRRLEKELTIASGPVFPVAFLGRSGRLIVFTENPSRYRECDRITGAETASWPAPGGAGVYSFALSADETTGLMIGSGGRAVIRDMRSGESTRADLSIGQVMAPKFSPDGRFFAAASHGIVQLWHTATRQEAATLSGVTGVYSVAFSPDGSRLATGGGSVESVKVWDLETNQPVISLQGSGALFGPTAFSADGTVLGSSSESGSLHLWRASSAEEIAAAEKPAPPRRP